MPVANGSFLESFFLHLLSFRFFPSAPRDSLIPYKTRPAPAPLTPRFPYREEKKKGCEIHHHQAHRETVDILKKDTHTKRKTTKNIA